MKNLLQKTTLLLFISAFTFSTSSAQIPNNDFELWEWSGLGGENPNEWYTSNGDLLPVNVFKASLTQYSGNYAVMLTNIMGVPASIGCGFPISYHPFQLKGYFKSEFLSADTAAIKISLFYNNQFVDSGEYFITSSIANWTSIAITISMNSTLVDSAAINITACKVQQNKCWVDLLSLEEPNSASDFISSPVKLYPNPSDTKIFIEGLENISSIMIYDLSGRVMKSFDYKNKSIELIDIADLSKGIYFLEIESAGNFYRKCFVKH